MVTLPRKAQHTAAARFAHGNKGVKCTRESGQIIWVNVNVRTYIGSDAFGPSGLHFSRLSERENEEDRGKGGRWGHVCESE